MLQTEKQKTKKTAHAVISYTYQDAIALLDKRWSVKQSTDTKKLLQLDAALGSPSKNVRAVFVAGSNGKSTTINLTSQLLRAEGLTVGSFYSPHFTTYNERIVCNNDSISNAAFTQAANDVFNAAVSLEIEFHAKELLTMMALHHFATQKVDVALLEVTQFDQFDPISICTPLICAITRITDYATDASDDVVRQRVEHVARLMKKGSWIISADQSKLSLQIMEALAEQKGAQWAMPIRKLAAMKYPYEQLFGRCAALAERIAQIFVQNIFDSKATNSLLAKPKGNRGRPTLEAKRHAELNPQKTIEQFWQETVSTLSHRFELLEKAKPTVLLDTASNLDAFKNLLLGVRLLHYQRPFKGLVIVVGSENNALHHAEFCKMLRYFFKKTAGQVVFCQPASDAQSTSNDGSWDVEQITNDVKNMKVKARSTKTLAQALDYAKKAVDETNGLIVITGSRAIVSEYWNTKTKK